jgi:3',5'-cyclic AMP phosphodiesterase CpdA
MAYGDFIPENVALPNSRRIGIYDSNGNRVGQMPLGTLTPPNQAKMLYKVGVLSDIHLPMQTGEEDFKRAMGYLIGTEQVDFIAICGDLTYNGTNTELANYKEKADAYRGNTPIYAVAGNHENYPNGVAEGDIEGRIPAYTGHPLYYTFTNGNDAYIMVGVRSNSSDNLFTVAELQWLYETLEANRNKRCFVFEHVFPWDGSGDVLNAYSVDLLKGTVGSVFRSLMRHYKNVIWFHGHSHVKFDGQLYGDMANIDKLYGMYSLHIPSLCYPAEGDADRGYIYAESEGYVMDVYADGIHLRGRDFVRGEFLLIASYWLDTTIKPVEAGTYTDPTGTINA